MAKKKPQPTTLSLGGHEWTVERADLDDLGLLGDCVHGKRRIRVDSALGSSQRDEILIHECTHAVSQTFALGLTEQQTRVLGVGLQQMLAPFLRIDI